MKNISIFSLCLLVLLNACKKDNSDDQLVAAKKLVKMANVDDEKDYITIEYDAQGRVIRYDEGDDLSTFTYNGNEVKIKEVRTSENREVFSFNGTLNAKGLLTQATAISQYVEGVPQGLTFTYEYNNDGYMTKKTRTSSNGDVYVYEYFYSKGNLIEYKVYRNGTFDWGGKWEYSDAPADKSNMSWEQFSYPNKFAGKGNKLMPTKYIASSGWYANFVYTIDNLGYPVSCTTSYDSGDVYKYQYTFE